MHSLHPECIIIPKVNDKLRIDEKIVIQGWLPSDGAPGWGKHPLRIFLNNGLTAAGTGTLKFQRSVPRTHLLQTDLHPSTILGRASVWPRLWSGEDTSNEQEKRTVLGAWVPDVSAVRAAPSWPTPLTSASSAEAIPLLFITEPPFPFVLEILE